MATEIVNQETNVDVTDDLDAFEDAFFEREQVTPETSAESEEIEEAAVTDEQTPEDDEDSETPEEEAQHDDDEPTDEEEETDLFKVKRKKTAGERIRELTAARHEAERREAELQRRLDALEHQSKDEKEEKEPAKPSAALDKEAPDPDEALEDGAPKYPLGEFDPKYIRDLTKFTIAQETAQARAREAEAAEARRFQEAEQALATSWQEKLATVAPEVKEEIAASTPVLESAFRDINPDYGKYLASTIMAMDYGPQVLHYLASNIGEAQRIVASGPTAATIALGRIEARFENVPERKKVRESKAPPPPPTNRGSGGKLGVSGDTDDLDAFEKAFFK